MLYLAQVLSSTEKWMFLSLGKKCTDARYKIIHGQVEKFRFSYNGSEVL